MFKEKKMIKGDKGKFKRANIYSKKCHNPFIRKELECYFCQGNSVENAKWKKYQCKQKGVDFAVLLCDKHKHYAVLI